eukprot:symbB.v1.2.019291.t1/scaffold1574.1/size208356/4
MRRSERSRPRSRDRRPVPERTRPERRRRSSRPRSSKRRDARHTRDAAQSRPRSPRRSRDRRSRRPRRSQDPVVLKDSDPSRNKPRRSGSRRRSPDPDGSKLLEKKSSVDPMALLEAACEIESNVEAKPKTAMPSLHEALTGFEATLQPGEAVQMETPRITRVQTVSIPLLAKKDNRPETSSSSTPSSSLSPSPDRGDLEMELDQEPVLGPLERYLLRGGEILENITIESKALAHERICERVVWRGENQDVRG